jgi:hypothetical protein
MELIRVLDHVQSCSSYDDGNVIFELIAPRVREGEDVTLSFEGVSAVPSSFINAAIVRLAEVVPLGEIRKHLSLTRTTRQINEMVKMRFDHLAAHG